MCYVPHFCIYRIIFMFIWLLKCCFLVSFFPDFQILFNILWVLYMIIWHSEGINFCIHSSVVTELIYCLLCSFCNGILHGRLLLTSIRITSILPIVVSSFIMWFRILLIYHVTWNEKTYLQLTKVNFMSRNSYHGISLHMSLCEHCLSSHNYSYSWFSCTHLWVFINLCNSMFYVWKFILLIATPTYI